MKLRSIIIKIPFATNLWNFLKYSSAYYQNLIFRSFIDKRIAIKRKNKEKINVIFVCHRPSVWESLHSVYDVLKNDKRFNVIIVAIPNKKELPELWLNHEEYETEGAEEFWKSYGCIEGFNYITKEWLDLRLLSPDYVFFQQPYNVTRCKSYKSWVVSRYAKLLFVPYGMQIMGGEVLKSVHPADFMNNLSYYFCPNDSIRDELAVVLNKNGNHGFTKIVVTGFPRYDQFLKPLNSDGEIWTSKEICKKFRILWTPRWCTNEGTCTFFDYKDHILQYAKDNKDVEIVLRPHPQAFSEWNTTGELTADEQYNFRLECAKAGIKIDEEARYINTIRTADCFLADPTSLMGEYFVTGKPIIYTYKRNCFTKFGKDLSKGYYYCYNWEEVKVTLDNLKKGKDSLLERRREVLSNNFVIKAGGAGGFIRHVILRDAGYE